MNNYNKFFAKSNTSQELTEKFHKITMYINMIFVLKNNTKQSRTLYLSYPLLMRRLAI